MADYDFHKTFGAYEFQDFARDIVQIREGLTFESFSEGKDMGIDNRYVGPDGSVTILQAKRWAQSASVSRSELKKERQKLAHLKVDRYIIAFSRDLSVRQKQDIFELFSPYIKDTGDIIGAKDLNNYIGQDAYKKVKEQYIKLWLQDADVLKNMLQSTVHSEIMEASVLELEDARDKARRFVETDVYGKALERLRQSKTLIISGEPGVGKTTLANHLALSFYVRNGFETIAWVKSIGDLYKVNQMPGRKIVVFDDFWGSNLFEGTGGRNEEEQLARFIELIYRQKDYYLILTTREYILEQGLKRNADLRELIEKYKLECRMEEYSAEEKLKIYLSHLEEGEMTWEQMEALFYANRQITASPNYNPRVIEMFVKNISAEQSGQECVEQLMQYIAHPKDFWSKIYENLTVEARVIYIIMLLLPLPVDFERLKSCFYKVLHDMDKAMEWKELPKIIKELEETVIKTIASDELGNWKFVTFCNPSAKDYIYEYVRENFMQYREMLFNSCIYFSQSIELLRLSVSADAPYSFSERVVGLAISLIRSKSAAMPKSMIWALDTYERENNKYIFKSEKPTQEVGKERFYELLYQYDKRFCEKYNSFFKSEFDTILCEMEKYPEYMLNEDMAGFIKAVQIVLKEGICNDVGAVLGTYISCLMRNRMRLNIGELKREFGQFWQSYFDEHRETLTAYMTKYYRAELCVAAVENDVFRYWDVEEQYYEDLGETGLELLKEAEEYKSQYDAWLSYDEEDVYEDIKEQAGKKKQKYEDIIDEFEEMYLSVLQPTEVDEIEEYMSENGKSMYLSDVLCEVSSKYELRYWGYFTADEHSLEFLISFYEYKGEFSEDIVQAAEDIFNYIEHVSGIEKAELIKFLSSLPIQEEEEQENIWTEKQLTDGSDLLMQNPSYLDKLAEAGVFTSSGKWYRLCNSMIVLFTRIEEAASMSDKGRAALYRSAFADTDLELLRIKALSSVDKEYFENHIYDPAVNDFYQEVYDKDEQNVIYNLIRIIDLDFDLDASGEVMGMSYGKNIYFDIREEIYDDYLSDLIPETFSKKKVEILKREGLLKDNGAGTVSLMELYEKGLLADMGLMDNLLKMWEQLKDAKGVV